jgi:ABC-type multidrug transport system fused ATPase/permease subunit
VNSSLNRYWGFLAKYLGPQRWRVALLGLLLVVGIALQLANPQILKSFIDLAVGGGAPGDLLGAALLFLGVALAGQVVVVAEAFVAENVGLFATNRLRADLALHCLRLDPSFHNAHSPGELIERVDGDVATLGNFFSRFVIHMLGNAILLVGVLALLFGIDWRVGLTLTLFTAVAMLLINRLRDLAVPQWAAARQGSAALFGFLEERMAGTEDLRANGATNFAMRQLYERSRDLLHQQRRASLLGVTTGSTTVLFLTIGGAVALGLGAYLYSAGIITIGSVYLIFSYTELLRRPIEQISRQLQDFQQAAAGMTRIQDLLELRSAVQDGAGAPFPPGAPSIAFEGVSFAYDDGATTNDQRRTDHEEAMANSDSPHNTQYAIHDMDGTQYATCDLVLDDISFQLEPGQVLGVLGRTGSGKTTLIRLLFRLYDPLRGAVRLGGVDLRDARLAELRRDVGMVTQDIQLFNASLRDNLALFDSRIADERIVAAIESLGLGEWFRGLLAGLDTRLAPGASGLSAGEAQLLAFARVFLKNPGLVILDEASSRLDPATERRLEAAVDQLLDGRTGIIIAHRLATIERADMVLILEDGRIREYGPRARLASDPSSRFAQLLRVGMEEVLA